MDRKAKYPRFVQYKKPQKKPKQKNKKTTKQKKNTDQTRNNNFCRRVESRNFSPNSKDGTLAKF